MRKQLILLTTVIVLAFYATAQPVLPLQITDSVSCTPIKDQAQSPTCWAFCGTSLFETDLLKQGNPRLDLSEMFIARHAYLDKAKQHVATGGKTYYEGGGQFRDIFRVIKRFGIVPEGAYSGLVNDAKLHDHAAMDTAMRQYIRSCLVNGKTALSDIDIANLNDTLDKYLGKLPSQFSFNEKSYTPTSFARSIGLDTDDYIDLVSFANQPLYKKFLLNDKYNWAYDSLYNISLDDMMAVADTALHKGYGVAWEGDVTDTGFHYFGGYASMQKTVGHLDSIRIANYASEKTERDHGMHLIRSVRDGSGTKWYYLKNSWGRTNLKGGYLYMDENFFRLQTVILVVNKKGLPAALREKLGL